MISLNKKGIENAVQKTRQMPVRKKARSVVQVEVLQDDPPCNVSSELLQRKARPLSFHAAQVVPILDDRIRGLCTRPYPNHPKGCPNFGERPDCPPKEKHLEEVFDATQSFWALWAEFDFAAHRAKMQHAHPTWSDRQVDCCLYWQGTVRKFLRHHAQAWLVNHAGRLSKALVARQGIMYTEGPEAMGVNVTATMKKIGVELEWPPKNIVRKIFLAGVKAR